MGANTGCGELAATAEGLGLPCNDGRCKDASGAAASSAFGGVPWFALPRETLPGLSCCSLDGDMVHVTAAGVAGGKKLEELYEFDRSAKPLGKGGFGMVFMARLKKDPSTTVAIKMMDKVRLRQMKAPADMVCNEVELLRECRGRENFVQLFDFIETTTKYCLVLEYCGSGTLQDATMSTDGFLGEAQVKFVMQQILDSIACLHSRNICHRDIKPHNFMVVSGLATAPRPANAPNQACRATGVDGTMLAGRAPPQRSAYADHCLEGSSGQVPSPVKSQDGRSQELPSSGEELRKMFTVKLGDFGTAMRVVPGKLAKHKVGTPAFMSPEMHLLPGRSPGYDHKVDVWAAGVVMIFLLANEHPFVDGAGRLLRHKLISGEVPLWETGTFQDLFVGMQEAVGMRSKRPSRLARDLVLHLLTPARQDRATAESLLRHQWFKPPFPLDAGHRETTESQSADATLLEWKDFEDGLAAVGRDLQWAMAMMTGAAPPKFSTEVCVVCYRSAGGGGYTCPQCSQTVCDQCLVTLPKATCPYCSREVPRNMVVRIPQARNPVANSWPVPATTFPSPEKCRPNAMNVQRYGQLEVVTC